MDINEVINPMTVCKCIKDSQEKSDNNNEVCNEVCNKCSKDNTDNTEKTTDLQKTINSEDQDGGICLCVCLSYFCLIIMNSIR